MVRVWHARDEGRRFRLPRLAPDAAPSPARAADVAHLVEAWGAALAASGYVPMSSVEIERFLHRLTCRLVDALYADPFVPESAYDVGVALVDAHFVSAEALGRSIRVIGSHLLTVSGPGSPNGHHPDARLTRLAAVQGAMAAGYVHALRNRTLEEQEAIRRADIDARRHAEEALRASEARFRAVFAEAGIGIGLADMEGRIVDANQAFASMLGYTIPEFCKLQVTDFVHPDDAPGMWDAYREMISGDREGIRLEKRYRHRDGSVVWTNMTASLIRDGAGRPRYTIAMVEDISDRRLLQDRLRHQAHHDPLTQLPNRALFFERLADSFSDPQARVGLCYLDLDGFKAINDTLGHDTGDQLLVAVADRLDQAVSQRRSQRESRTRHLVARMGGDEFVILVEHSTGTPEVTELATATLAALEAPFRIAGHRLAISASIGVVERPVSGTTPAEVMKAADVTLYWAKSDGKGRWALFDAERNDHAVTRYALSTTMPAALDRGEFTIEYQPLISLADESLRGAEALVRWRHPTLGLLAPDQFIDLAEETGVIVPLGRWVLENACRQARRWQEQFPDAGLFVSVNLAVRQAWDATLVDDVARILTETGLAPGLLQLELTETALMGAAGRPLEALQALSGMGVRIAIDDFGTGYSNLAYLRWLPVHGLKLHGSFVEGLRCPERSSPLDEPIVATLVSLAHTLGLTVTAEGVENPGQAGRLRDIGCDAAQGWHFAPPASPEEITRQLRTAGPAGTMPPPRGYLHE
jgi:diguanylate cyclase (GGDEF)-like protein/PAS domain S-box-containing protein